MAVGDVLNINGIEYEVVWGGEELLPERPSKPTDTWEPPTRPYNRTGLHTEAAKTVKKLKTDLWLKSMGLDKPEKEVQAIQLTDEQLTILED